MYLTLKNKQCTVSLTDLEMERFGSVFSYGYKMVFDIDTRVEDGWETVIRLDDLNKIEYTIHEIFTGAIGIREYKFVLISKVVNGKYILYKNKEYIFDCKHGQQRSIIEKFVRCLVKDGELKFESN